MLKQDYAKEIFKLLNIEWSNEDGSTGSTITKDAMQKIYEKLIELKKLNKLKI